MVLALHKKNENMYDYLLSFLSTFFFLKKNNIEVILDQAKLAATATEAKIRIIVCQTTLKMPGSMYA